MKTLQQQRCLSPASNAGSFVSALIGLKASEKSYCRVLNLTKLKGEAGKSSRRDFCKMYGYTSNWCRTKLLLVKQPLSSGSGEMPETETVTAGLV